MRLSPIAQDVLTLVVSALVNFAAGAAVMWIYLHP